MKLYRFIRFIGICVYCCYKILQFSFFEHSILVLKPDERQRIFSCIIYIWPTAVNQKPKIFILVWAHERFVILYG